MLAGQAWRNSASRSSPASAKCEELEAKIEKAGEDLKAGQIELQAVQFRSVALAKQYDSLRGEHNAGELAIAELQLAWRTRRPARSTCSAGRRSCTTRSTPRSIRQENLTSQQVRLNGRSEIVSALERP